MANTKYRVIYNDIEMSLTHINRYDMIAEYSDDGVSQKYIHCTISVEGLINKQVNPETFNGFQTANNADWLAYLRQFLNVPRKKLVVWINGEVNLTTGVQPPDGPGIDAKNGPIPSGVRVIQVDGESCMVEFTIDTWVSCTTQSPYDQQALVASRWTQTHEIDKDLRSTITTNGYVIARTDWQATDGFTPTDHNIDYLRNTIAPVIRIQQGTNRLRQSFHATTDGSRLDYTLVDQEYTYLRSQYLYPVYTGQTEQTDNSATWDQSGPVVNWEATWDEEAIASEEGFAFGNAMLGTFNISAVGSPVTPISTLVNFCIQMFTDRRPKKDNNNSQGYLRAFKMTEYLHERRINLTVTLYFIGQTGNTYNKNNADSSFVMPPTLIGNTLPHVETNTTKTSQAPTRGTQGVWKIFNSLPLQPCATQNTLPDGFTGVSLTPTIYGGASGPQSQSYMQQTNKISDAGEANIYIRNKVERQTHEETNNWQMPIATSLTSVPCFTANFGQAYSKTIVRFDLARINAVPQIPTPTLSGCTLLYTTLNQPEPEFLPSYIDRVYSISGEHVYMQTNNVDIGNATITYPKSPNDAATTAQLSPVVSASFDNTLVT